MRSSPLLLSLLLLLPSLLAGCTSSSPPPQTDETNAWWPEDALVYNVTGPLYIPGFWPDGEANFIENETVAVTINGTRTILDAARRPTLAVNLTYHTQDRWVTHWTAPQTGKLIALEYQAQPAVFGHFWSWNPQGEPALLGYWNETPPKQFEIPCCPSSPAMWNRDGGTALFERVQAGSIEVPRVNASDPWQAPDPRPGERERWNHHWPPGARHDLTTPLPRAVDAARNNSQTVRSFMNQNPDWQVVDGTYWNNPTPVNSLNDDRDEGDWLLKVASETKALNVEVKESNYVGPVRTYEVEAEAMDADGNWVSPNGSIQLMPVTDAWNRTVEIIPADQPDFNRVAQFDTMAGGLWTAGVWWGGAREDGVRWMNSLTLNLETGLVSGFFSRNEPSQVLDWNHPEKRKPSSG